jgi:hypothetical protein
VTRNPKKITSPKKRLPESSRADPSAIVAFAPTWTTRELRGGSRQSRPALARNPLPHYRKSGVEELETVLSQFAAIVADLKRFCVNGKAGSRFSSGRAEALRSVKQMEVMDGLDPAVAALFEAKAKRRRELAALPFAERVAAVVKLQEMAAPILRARGKAVRPWRIVASAGHS